MNEKLSAYTQYATSHPVDGFEPGDDKQRVDLQEMYEETNQDNATNMVNGIEELSRGVMSKRTAVIFKLTGAHDFDPFPSERNLRRGNEGFLTTIKESFKSFLENVIKYIRMGINWVVDTVKTLLGFKKSERIEKAINAKLPELKVEMSKTLTGLGFPGNDYNLENYIGTLPAATDRLGQMTIMKSKLQSDEEAIKALLDILPTLQKASAKIRSVGQNAEKAAKNLKRVISDEYKRTVAKAHVVQQPLDKDTSTELPLVIKACQEVNLALDDGEITEMVNEVYKNLYGITFTNTELNEGFNKVRATLKERLSVEKVKLEERHALSIMTTIEQMTARYAELSDKEVSLEGIDWKSMGNIINKDDGTKIEEMARGFNSPIVLAVYQKTALALRNFTNFCLAITQSMLQVYGQCGNLIEWHGRAHAWYYHALIGDLDVIAKIHQDAASKGFSPHATDHEGYLLRDKLVIIKDDEAQTVLEKTSEGLKTAFDLNFGGAKTSYNNFVKQTGWGKSV